MIRYFGRILNTLDNRLMKKVFLWDKHLNESNLLKSWSSEVQSILYNNNLNYIYDLQLMFPIKNIVDKLKSSLFENSRLRLKLNVEINQN